MKRGHSVPQMKDEDEPKVIEFFRVVMIDALSARQEEALVLLTEFVKTRTKRVQRHLVEMFLSVLQMATFKEDSVFLMIECIVILVEYQETTVTLFDFLLNLSVYADVALFDINQWLLSRS
ncbi:hypothetical protein L1987_63721 [Smallanthus sonchifolius]|uniref:Uncharacterized protein n=1 Tax=Smallanthus sonchifolius TaxID=185202 RepID=A0ACB9CE29_9ASTR|nr:hypothetical protein L1987_63721 [Smallanthus sonchifolius]